MRRPTQEEIDALQALLDEDGREIVTVGTRLGQEAVRLVMVNAKPIKRLQDRLLKEARKQIVHRDNALDLVTTRLLTSANTFLAENEMLLQNLGVKGGVIQPGDPITAALANEAAQGPQLQTLGTLVLAVKEAVPFFEQLIHVLREIRDRLPGSPVAYKGETPSGDPQEVIDDLDAPGEQIEFESLTLK